MDRPSLQHSELRMPVAWHRALGPCGRGLGSRNLMNAAMRLRVLEQCADARSHNEQECHHHHERVVCVEVQP